MENPGIDPGTSHMLSERSTTWANSPCKTKVKTLLLVVKRAFPSFLQYLIAICTIRSIDNAFGICKTVYTIWTVCNIFEYLWIVKQTFARNMFCMLYSIMIIVCVISLKFAHCLIKVKSKDLQRHILIQTISAKRIFDTNKNNTKEYANFNKIRICKICKIHVTYIPDNCRSSRIFSHALNVSFFILKYKQLWLFYITNITKSDKRLWRIRVSIPVPLTC